MKARVWSAVAIALAGAAIAFAGDPPPKSLEDAQREFKLGVEARHDAAAAREHFRAASYWDAMKKLRYQTPGMWRMAGNASLLSGDVVPAIVNYRQGLVLD